MAISQDQFNGVGSNQEMVDRSVFDDVPVNFCQLGKMLLHESGALTSDSTGVSS